MEIKNATEKDIDEIFNFYETASAYMKDRYEVYWPPFKRSMVEKEIKENRQWKLIIENKTACIWATTFDDPQIWEEKNTDPAVYIHRIAVDPGHRGKNFVRDIVEWAKAYGKQNGKKFIRLDTVGENHKLIAHYQKCEFTFLGLKKLKDTSCLPGHYQSGDVSLFETAIA
jgi:ribosomal protein S18 acetylase RimI-like enzyme